MLQNFYGVIQVKHYQNGRLRLQTDILRENVELEQEFLNTIRDRFSESQFRYWKHPNLF